MSYPVNAVRSHRIRDAEHGEFRKEVAHVQAGEGTRSLWLFGEYMTYKVPSDQTGGAYALFEVTTQPGAGLPPHVQHREDESFYVLEGEFGFSFGEETLRVGGGSLIYVPKGTLHAHKNVGQGVGKMLVSQTPGGLYERFFEETGRAADGDYRPLIGEDQADVGRIVEIAAKYGIEISPPITQW